MNGPQVPNASDLIKQATQSNQQTAQFQAGLNNVNQVGPLGSQIYTSTPGKNGGPPQYTQTTALDPRIKWLLNKNLGTEGKLASTAGGLAAKLPSQLNSGIGNFGTDRTAVEKSLFDRINPQLNQQETSLRTRLAGQGIKEGTDAWNHALDTLNRQRNDLGLDITAHGLQEQQGQQGLAVGRNNQLISQILQLQGGSQGPQPQFNPTPQTGVQGTDTAGIAQQSFQNQQNQSNGFWGGLGALGSTIGGWLFSDPSLKEDIRDTGMVTAEDHIPIKTFAYKGSPILNMGVMADEVEEVRPDAVRQVGAFKQVHYGKIGSPMLQLGMKKAA